MKSHLKKIFIGLLLITALMLSFYPTKNTLDITGRWHLDNITVNGKPLSLNEYALYSINIPWQFINIDKNQIDVSLLNNKNIKAHFYYKGDSLTIETDKEILKGTFKVNFSEKINLLDNAQAKEYKLKLTSKKKTITLSRDEVVKWIQPQVQRGRP